MLDGAKVGTIGVLHPDVLDKFQLKNPVSVFELDFEPIWTFFKTNNACTNSKPCARKTKSCANS